MSRQPQQFDEREAIKRMQQSIKLVMFYADQNKPLPAHAIEKVRSTQKEIEQKLK